MARAVALAALVAVAGACGSPLADPAPEADAAPARDSGEPGPRADAGAPLGDGAAPGEALEAGPGEADAAIAADRFITGVVSFDPGECAGFGASSMPGVVEGPPYGGGASHGSTDVVSLGGGGSIVVSFAPDAIVDGPGVDFIVFENPFEVGGDPDDIYAEPGEVSVSEDGVTWHTFPCDPTTVAPAAGTTGVVPPYGQCAGWHPVYSSPGNGISPIDPSVAGGDGFDLADVGVTRASYVRIVDKTNEVCPEGGARPDQNGFDLDAISIVNAADP